MIAYLSGTLAEKTLGRAVVDVGGVGYAVFIPLTTYNRLGETSAPVTLFTHLNIRENAQELFGFLSAAERDLFERLIEVNGVGPKLALSVLSVMEPQEFRRAILTSDTRSLSRVPGVGKKTAERLVMELSDSFGAKGEFADVGPFPGASPVPDDPQSEALLALVNLGFRQPEAAQAVRTAAKDLGEDASSEALLKEALRRL